LAFSLVGFFYHHHPRHGVFHSPPQPSALSNFSFLSALDIHLDKTRKGSAASAKGERQKTTSCFFFFFWETSRSYTTLFISLLVQKKEYMQDTSHYSQDRLFSSPLN
jgi:hypothetical protein